MRILTYYIDPDRTPHPSGSFFKEYMSKEYIRFSENYKINQLIPVTESPHKYIKNKNSPYFISMMKYNEDQYKEFQKTKSLAGLSGGKTNKIWADFDSESHLDAAFSDAVIFVKDLLNIGIKEEEIQISFSGNKGIGIIVETNNEFTIEQVKSFCFDLLSGLTTFDKTMYDHQRIFRLNYTKNEKTNLYKIPITYEELVDANIEEIKKRAAIDPTPEEIQDVNDYYQISNSKIPDEYLNVQKLEVIPKDIVVHGEINWELKPKFLSNCRWALQNGLFEPGFRSNPLLCLASTYKNLGYSQGITYRMLKGVAEAEAERNQSERYPDKELYNNIILQVFSERWKNGQFSCKQEGNFLYDYCQTLGDHKCDHTEDTKHIIKINDLATSFEDYAVNFEKNIVKTGISGIDENVMFLTSTLNGILGQPGSGKTSMVLQWLKNNSELNSNSLFYSLDMGKPIIYAKLIQQTIGCSFKEATEILKNDKKRFLEIKDKVGINFKNVNFNFKSGMQVENIKYDIKAHEDRTGEKLRLLVIDYLECLAGPYSDSTANTGYISNQMKDLANEMEVCAVMLLQTQKHATSEICDPLLSMRKIKGASVIEQSASVIMTLWREGYNPKTVNEDKYISFAAVKNRFGPLWSDDFKWDGKKGYVSNLEDYDRQLLSEFRSHKEAVKKEEKAESSSGGSSWS